MKKSTKLFIIYSAFLAGIIIVDLIMRHCQFEPSGKINLSLIISAVFLSVIGLIWRNRLTFVLLILAIMIFGMWRMIISRPQIDSTFIAYYNEQKITFRGLVKEPDARIDQVKLTIQTAEILTAPATEWQPVNGLVLVSEKLYPEYDYGDMVEVKCKLRAPKPIEDFRYDRYLARYNIYSTCYNPSITKIAVDQGNFIIAGLLTAKKYFSSIINQTIPEPQASFLAGILLGSRKGIPAELLEGFNRTGITHIIAISGYNITIISVMIMNLCLAVSINRKRAFYVILIGIIFFTIITGASAAVVRSAIMGLIVLFAKYIGRKSRVHLVLVMTAAGMAIANPKILLDDAGFQLSFLATIGLIYFVPVIEKYFTRLPSLFAIQENFVTTLSAIILTTPLILYQFGRLSIAAPLVNLLILSFIPPAMAAGFIQVLAGIIWLDLGRIIGWLTWLILQYIIAVVKIFSSWSLAAIDVSMNLWVMLFVQVHEHSSHFLDE